MTITLARLMQLCFTWCMATTTPRKRNRETTDEKAERLIAEGRYTATRASEGGAFWVGTCQGDSGETYNVVSVSQQFMDEHNIIGGSGFGLVACDCRYGKDPINELKACSHGKGADIIRRTGEK